MSYIKKLALAGTVVAAIGLSGCASPNGGITYFSSGPSTTKENKPGQGVEFFFNKDDPAETSLDSRSLFISEAKEAYGDVEDLIWHDSFHKAQLTLYEAREWAKLAGLETSSYEKILAIKAYEGTKNSVEFERFHDATQGLELVRELSKGTVAYDAFECDLAQATLQQVESLKKRDLSNLAQKGNSFLDSLDCGENSNGNMDRRQETPVQKTRGKTYAETLYQYIGEPVVRGHFYRIEKELGLARNLAERESFDKTMHEQALSFMAYGITAEKIRDSLFSSAEDGIEIVRKLSKGTPESNWYECSLAQILFTEVEDLMNRGLFLSAEDGYSLLESLECKKDYKLHR